MNPEGVLTFVDLEAENQRLAKQAYADAGFATARTRLIFGTALDVLPRLTDGAYDLVFCDGEKKEYGDYLREACGCCGSAAWSRSTMRRGTTGSPILHSATRPRSRSATWASSCGKSQASCRRCYLLVMGYS